MQAQSDKPDRFLSNGKLAFRAESIKRTQTSIQENRKKPSHLQLTQKQMSNRCLYIVLKSFWTDTGDTRWFVRRIRFVLKRGGAVLSGFSLVIPSSKKGQKRLEKSSISFPRCSQANLHLPVSSFSSTSKGILTRVDFISTPKTLTSKPCLLSQMDLQWCRPTFLCSCYCIG